APISVAFFAGVPGDSVGAVRYASGGGGGKKGQPVAGARIFEGPIEGAAGYTFEASVPWDAFPEAKTLRIGLTGALRFERSGGVASIGTNDAKALVPLPTTPESSVEEGLLAPRHLTDPPKFVLYADVVGDLLKEKVAVYDHLFVLSGPGYRNGAE